MLRNIAGGIKPDDLKTIGVSFVTPVATVFGVPVSIKPTQKERMLVNAKAILESAAP
jgi:hypothetical protein